METSYFGNIYLIYFFFRSAAQPAPPATSRVKAAAMAKSSEVFTGSLSESLLEPLSEFIASSFVDSEVAAC